MARTVIKTIALSCSTFTGFLVYHLPNSTFLDTIQNVMQHYIGGVPVPVSNDIKKLKETVMNDMKFSEEDKKKIELFTCSGFGFFYAGSTWSSKLFGGFNRAIIGIPANLNWETVTFEMENNIILSKSAPIDWNAKEADMLRESLILSEKAKKFALAQNLFYVSKCEPLVKGAFTSSLLFLSFFYIDKFRNLKSKYNGLQYAVISLSLVFHFSLWFIGKDVYKCHLEGKADETLSKLGEDYIEGGLDLYETILRRNIALRSLLGKDGESKYSLFGNDEMLFRTNHLPLTSRRDFFKKLN